MKIWIESEVLRCLTTAVGRYHSRTPVPESQMEPHCRYARETRAILDAADALLQAYDRPPPLEVNRRHEAACDSKAAIRRIRDLLEGRVLAEREHPRARPA